MMNVIRLRSPIACIENGPLIAKIPAGEIAIIKMTLNHFTYEGPNKISGIGYTVAGPKLLAMRFVLVKENVD